MFGRPVCDFEMETSLAEYWDFLDSNDKDTDPKEMKKVIGMMQTMGSVYAGWVTIESMSGLRWRGIHDHDDVK